MKASLVVLLVLLATLADGFTLDEPFQTSFARLSHAACVSLFYRDGRMGCSTVGREVQTGELKYYDSSVKFPNYPDPFVLVMDEPDFSTSNIQAVLGNNKWGLLKGILVLNATKDGTYRSPAPQAPQGKKTPSKNVNYGSNYAWNSNGDALYIQNFYGVPMAYLNEADVSSYIRNVSQDSDSSIVAEFNYYMGPESMDSPTCLSWRDVANGEWSPKCQPLGGTSVWAVAGSPEVIDERRRLEDGDGSSTGRRPVVMVATSIDATTMFHDAVPAANSAASNILTLLMAAKLLGSNVDDATLDALPNRILFGFFQGEQYGFIGSRAFLRDVAFPGFECDETMTVSSLAKSNATGMACLYPLRHSLEFQKLGAISGMIAVDQVGVLATDQTLYAHTDGSDFGGFLSNVLLASSTNDFSVSASDVAGQYYPPTPLTSLLQLSAGAIGGAILAGYNDAFVTTGYYHSHKDSVKTRAMNMDAIASAATLLARAALAAAYDNGSYDSATASSYAANLISELSSEDETLLTLANCLYVDGSCAFLREYAQAEALNEKKRSGLDLGIGVPFGTPPNYYVSVYNIDYGQPFVKVGEDYFGAYNGTDYGKKSSDAFSIRPSLLEMGIRGMLNDFLGRGSVDSSGSVASPSSCSSHNDCSGVSYCSQDRDLAVCTAKKVCVCARSHYHIALDEALVAPPNNQTGLFVVSDDDEGISAMYTEPNWSNSVGVHVYRDAGQGAGYAVLGIGIAMASVCVGAALILQRRMKKEKLY
jgi:nicastrin